MTNKHKGFKIGDIVTLSSEIKPYVYANKDSKFIIKDFIPDGPDGVDIVLLNKRLDNDTKYSLYSRSTIHISFLVKDVKEQRTKKLKKLSAINEK